MTVDDHRGRIPDEKGRNSGFVEDASGHRVVRGDHRPALAADGGLRKVTHGHTSSDGSAVEGVWAIRDVRHDQLRSRGSLAESPDAPNDATSKPKRGGFTVGISATRGRHG